VSGLDFKRASDLFMGSEKELALAIGVTPEELRRYRADPGKVPGAVLERLGKVLIERGRGMVRVGEMLASE